VAEAYSLTVHWGDVLFDKAVRDGSQEYVSEMASAGHLATEICRAAVDKYVTHYHSYSFLPVDVMLSLYMLSLCVRLSVCPSVCHKPALYQNG